MKLTEKVRQKVIMDLLYGKYSPGDKLPSEREMTVITHTSRITVRRAYDQLEKNGVIERKPKQGTKIAKSFKGNQQDITEVGIITDLKHQFSRDFIESVHDTCMENDALITLALSNDSVEQVEQSIKLVSRGLRNIIVCGYDCNLDLKTFERIRALGVNIVFFDRMMPGPFADYVGLDNQHAIATLIGDALENNVDNLIYVDISDVIIDSNIERRQNFIREASGKGCRHAILSIPYNPKDKFEPLNLCHDFLAKESYMSSSAIICTNDKIALSILGACPRDMPVYSIDGSQSALQAGIISYRQPVREMAAAAVNSLQKQQIKGDKWKAKNIRLKGELLKP